MGRPDAETRAAIARRRADAIDLRLAGVDWLTIARKLAADPFVNSDGVPYPEGYGIQRYRRGAAPPTNRRLVEYAHRDVSTALAERRVELDAATDDLRQMMYERLERLFFVVYRVAVTQQDFAAVDRAAKIIAQTCRLLGLDAPARTEVTGADGGPLAVTQQVTMTELEHLIELAGNVTPPAAATDVDED
ncbi:hypothetical protein [Embleya sp. NPDC059237]|uniref:hypothetical protein n=1 Tax=Embleya sp. NPDC059237 TaxID=3346784 RepID=UPI0036A66275